MFTRREAFKLAASCVLLKKIPAAPPVPWKNYTCRYSPIKSDELFAKLRAAREKHTFNLTNQMEEAMWG